jgi:AcrR family transcriptional regulator
MRQEIKELRRRQIVEAALATFAARGYDKTTMEDIRVASDVSKGTLYLYFDSKEALFAAVVNAMFEDLLAYLAQAANESHAESAAGRLRTFLTALNQTFEQDEQRVGLYTDFFVQAWQHNSVRAVLGDAYQRYIALLTEMIQRGIDAGEFHNMDAEITARILTGALDGIVLQKLLDPIADFRPALSQFVEIFMRGLILT